MNQQDILTKLHDLKGNIQDLFAKVRREKDTAESTDDEVGFDAANGGDNYLDDLPLTINRDEEPSVTYYTTENSEFARGAEKTTPRGIDSFGERDTFSFEEADDFQTNRDRNQNSDLSKRFYTSGLDMEDL